MAKIDLTYNLENYTPASAEPVDKNFDTIEQHINQELIERDGTVQMRAQLMLVGDPLNALDAAPKQYVDQVLPIGIVMMHGGVGAPPGGRWLICNGAELQTTNYPDLWNIIGHNFSPDGTPGSRFHVPDLRDHFPMGVGANTPIGERAGYRNASLVEHHHGMSSHTHAMKNHTHPIDHDHPNSTTGSSGDHSHTISVRDVTGSAGGAARGGTAQSPVGTTSTDGAHTHTVNVAPQNKANSGWPSDNITYGPDDNNTSDEGVAAADRNLPPYVGVQYIIRAK
jgi:microcystin-dependent protein